MKPLYPAPESLLNPIQAILTSSLQGISEYELLKQLGLEIDYFSNTSSSSFHLFQRHFLLFHCLYLLQHDYFRNQSGILHISALEIRLWPYHAGEQNLDPADPVRDYYSNISNLESTKAEQVDDLLDTFWLSLSKNETRTEALKLLELSDPVDDRQIRKQYKKLAMQHHPDRGGDHARIQQLNIAIAQLLPKTAK